MKSERMLQMSLKKRPVVLMILDGWGVALPSRANAITQAQTPFFNTLIQSYPFVTLQASGEATGLPWGEVGNSEVGHMSIGAGRIMYQELSRVNAAISDGSFFSNPEFLAACDHVKKNKSALHLMGLVSPGGIHSHIDHLMALLELAQTQAVERVYIHAILDGRDTPYASASTHIQRLMKKIAGTNASLATMSGRFFSMDRDNHWDREERAFQAVIHGTSTIQSHDSLAVIQASYQRNIYDEEFEPTVLTDAAGGALGAVRDHDAFIFFNIRSDRARQFMQILSREQFEPFERNLPRDLYLVTMTEYEKGLPVHIAFPPQIVKNCLAEILSGCGLKQLHIAETEKYAHITYFLNVGREEPFVGEKRIMIPSPRIESYDKKPEMSATEITKTLIAALDEGVYDFIAVNYANADMVGHTGNMKATITAIETLDRAFSQCVPKILAKGGALLITADHGNAEILLDLQTGHIDKEHNTSPVPCIMISEELEGLSLGLQDVHARDMSILEPSAILSDVAPTILDMMGIEKPIEMTGNSILRFHL